MRCGFCDQEATGRCYNCGELFCDAHGRTNCTRCDTAIAPGDRRADRVSAAPLVDRGPRPGWWRPLPAEEYEPPACYSCKGLARTICRNCRRRYCPEHAGPPQLCADCGRSSALGLYFFVFAVVVMALLLLFGNWGN